MTAEYVLFETPHTADASREKTDKTWLRVGSAIAIDAASTDGWSEVMLDGGMRIEVKGEPEHVMSRMLGRAGQPSGEVAIGDADA